MDRATPRDRPELLQAILDSLPQHIALLSPDGTIALVNRSWRQFALDNANSKGLHDYLGQNYLATCTTVSGPEQEQAASVASGIAAVLDGSLPRFSLEYPCHSPTEERWFILNVTPLEGGRGGAVVSHLNITRRVLQERSIEELARIDHLTGLANRRSFFEQSALILAASRRYDRYLCLLFIDLDKFKDINDTWGHETGDNVLREIAVRVKGEARASDLVARLGGDEFVVLLEAPVEEAERVVARRYAAALMAPIDVAGTTLHPTASIGIATYSATIENTEELLDRADVAMYRAKRLGSGIEVHAETSP